MLLKDFCEKEHIQLKVYASLGNPAVFGHDFHQAISQAKIAINFNRDDNLKNVNPEKILGASDRMAQFLGCGICTFSPRIKGFEKLYQDQKDIVYFDSPSDCFEKLTYYLKEKKYALIAKNGQEKTYKIANSKRITQYMLELLEASHSLDDYEWYELDFGFELQIIGEGEQREELLKLIISSGLQNRIKLVGFVKNVQDYIYNSDLQIISSREEGLSLALIEGIFYANVLIATDIANHKQLLGESLVFDCHVDALVAKLNDLHTNYDKYRSFFAIVKATKENYTIDKMAQQYLEGYKSLLV